MNVYNIINDNDFLLKNQFEKRNIVKDIILTDAYCAEGLIVICFENEILSSSAYFYNKVNNHDKCKLTIGKEYRILDYNKNTKLIKVKNDIGLNVWTTPKRFILTLSYIRKDKLEKLNEYRF